MKKAAVSSILIAVMLLAVAGMAEAQQPKKVPRIAYVTGVSHSNAAPEEQAFRQGLRDLGYINGKNLSIESRYAEGKLDTIPSIVNEFVQEKVDIIVTVNNVATVAAKKATKTTPIVMVSSIDPVVAGYVDSLAHPGGNVTGVATMNRELSGKRIELIKELIPNVSRIAMLWDVNGPGPTVASKEYQETARKFKLHLQSLELHDTTSDIEGAFRAAQRERAEALIIITNPLTLRYRERIIELANRNRLPSMPEDIRFMNAGGLLYYAANISEVYRRVATYVDKILKGTKPADLPVEQPTKFELIISLKAAKQIGLTIPPNLLARADKHGRIRSSSNGSMLLT